MTCGFLQDAFSPSSFSFSLYPLDNITVLRIVVDLSACEHAQAGQVPSIIEDMDCDGCNPIWDRKDGKVSLQGRIHHRAVEDGLALFLVSHLLLGETGAEDIPGYTLPSMVVLAFNLARAYPVKSLYIVKTRSYFRLFDR
jgi:hypothetical protein